MVDDPRDRRVPSEPSVVIDPEARLSPPRPPEPMSPWLLPSPRPKPPTSPLFMWTALVVLVLSGVFAFRYLQKKQQARDLHRKQQQVDEAVRNAQRGF